MVPNQPCSHLWVLAILVGEFGPSPTQITPSQIISAAEARSIGWMAWGWDSPANNVTDDWFALSYTGDYTSSVDLTTYCNVAEIPTSGLLRLADGAPDRDVRIPQLQRRADGRRTVSLVHQPHESWP